MKNLLFAAISLIPLAFGTSPVFAAADCLFSWNANPPEEQVTHYQLTVNAVQHDVVGTSTRCSDIGVDPSEDQNGPHEATIAAVNQWGAGPASSPVQFGRPGAVTGFTVTSLSNGAPASTRR